jgi:transcriptional regulator with XRE-family HTH domain
MSNILPGNIHERIGDLRIEAGKTKKEVSEQTGIQQSQLSRMENDENKNISHKDIITLAKYYNVTTDYLLGVSDIRFRKDVELEELGLSHKALLRLMSGKVNTELLSRIIENRYFIQFMDVAEAYFEGAHDEGLLSRNQLIDLATSDISDFIKQVPGKLNEGRKDIRQLNAQKVSGNEADLEKLRTIFFKMMKEVKEEYAQSQEDITLADMRKQIQQIHQQAMEAQQQNMLDASTMADITASMLASANLDERTIDSFKKFMTEVFDQTAEQTKKIQ